VCGWVEGQGESVLSAGVSVLCLTRGGGSFRLASLRPIALCNEKKKKTVNALMTSRCSSSYLTGGGRAGRPPVTTGAWCGWWCVGGWCGVREMRGGAAAARRTARRGDDEKKKNSRAMGFRFSFNPAAANHPPTPTTHLGRVQGGLRRRRQHAARRARRGGRFRGRDGRGGRALGRAEERIHCEGGHSRTEKKNSGRLRPARRVCAGPGGPGAVAVAAAGGSLGSGVCGRVPLLGRNRRVRAAVFPLLSPL
jgi:hypothetical protein